MRSKKICMFDRECTFYETFEMESDLKVLKQLKEEIQKPQILEPGALPPIDLYISNTDEHHLSSACIMWLCKLNLIKEKDNIWDGLLTCSDEDVEWTKWRNKDLNEIYYRKITFHKDIQEIILQKLSAYEEELQEALITWKTEEETEKKEREKRYHRWSEWKIFKKIMPRGGELGQDGIIDAEYINNDTGEIIRMISRDIFDFGCFHYPQRLPNALADDELSDSEKELVKWLREFSPFKGVRM